MNIELNKLEFGNPNREQLSEIQTETFLDSLFKELSASPPPQNDSQQTSSELAVCMEYVHFLEQDPALKNKYADRYDATFLDFILQSLVKSGVDENELYEMMMSVNKDIVPLLYKLKFHYQRPRPKQLAPYLGINLFPFSSRSSDSPSYPSGHAFQSIIYAEVLGNKYPKYYQPLKQLANEITASRLYMGLHYPSDIEFAQYAADLVLNHPDFKKKYKL